MMEFPRIVIAALRGGSGKTILSIGIIAAWNKLGKSISPFKKGPDYIDAGWLALAAGRPCYNLDTFMVQPDRILASFISRSSHADISVIEGNRGLYDGIDMAGSTSTAELAKQLKAPVILCIDCTKTTRTMSAVAMGCMQFDPDVRIAGVVLNRVAGNRHEQMLRSSIEHHCGLPVLGAIPTLKSQQFPERHMGLVPTAEHSWALESIHATAQMALDYLDMDALTEVAQNCNRLEVPETSQAAGHKVIKGRSDDNPRIGIIRDSAFQFYYPENIEALEVNGAEIILTSPLTDTSLPPIDALYIGGGFPETHAEQLADNRTFRNDIKTAAENGLPIYAECGGLMYLGEELVLKTAYPMAGVLPIKFGFSKKPKGHGYTIATVEKKNPFYEIGTTLKGHEFHYSKVLNWQGSEENLAFSMQRGVGIHNRKDGICYKNVLATYTHVHALGTPAWAKALVDMARRYRKRR